MDHYLLFRLYGPMSAWGDTAVGEFRPSHAHPSRTAVLGLLAAALGIRREHEDDLLALDASVYMAIRLDLPGELLRDYHTTQVPPEGKKLRYYTRSDEMHSDKLHTILSQRDYRTDSGASVALRHRARDATALDRWKQALINPVLPPYLGRKACPLALPMDPFVVFAANLKAAFDSYPSCTEKLAEISGQLLFKAIDIRYYWEGEDAALEPEMSYPRRDRLSSRKRWQFAERKEHYASLPQTAEIEPGKER